MRCVKEEICHFDPVRDDFFSRFWSATDVDVGFEVQRKVERQVEWVFIFALSDIRDQLKEDLECVA